MLGGAQWPLNNITGIFGPPYINDQKGFHKSHLKFYFTASYQRFEETLSEIETIGEFVFYYSITFQPSNLFYEIQYFSFFINVTLLI